jgi:hypothetical protein
LKNFGFKILVAVGIVLILVSFLFAFPYVGFYINKQYSDITIDSVNVTGLDPEDPRNLLIFAFLSLGGAGLIVKAFV